MFDTDFDPYSVAPFWIFVFIAFVVLYARYAAKKRYPERLPEPDRSALRRPEVDPKWQAQQGEVRYE